MSPLSGRLFVCITALLSACGGGGEEAQEPPDLALGEAQYAKYCAVCHGPEGNGYAADMANSLRSPEFLGTATDAFLSHAIIRGRPGTSMSGWGASVGGPIDEGHELDSLVAWIRQWQDGPMVDVSSVHLEKQTDIAETIYELRCLDCHGEAGAGGPYISLNNPELHASASDGFLLYAIQKGRTGTAMPGFEEELTQVQMQDLVVWLREQALPPHQRTSELPDHDLGEPVLNPAGPEPTWSTEDRFVSVHEVFEQLEAGASMVFLDARPPSDYVMGHVTGAVSVPFYAVEEFLDQLPQEHWVIAYCACPHAESGLAADALEANGYDRVKVMDEGYLEWVDAGYPTVEGAAP